MNGSTGVTVMVTKREKALVDNIAKKVYKRFCPAGPDGQIEFHELVHLGVAGLLEAKKRFDETQGVPFLAFASMRIRGAMLDQIRTQPIVRTSQELARKRNALKKAKEFFFREGEEADDEKLAKKLGWRLEEVRRVSGQVVGMVQARENVERGDEENCSSQGEIIRDWGPGAENVLLRKELAATIQTCLEKLPSDDFRLVLLGRVLEDVKLKELAEAMDCSLQTVANRQEAAQKMMKECLERQGWNLKEFSQLFE